MRSPAPAPLPPPRPGSTPASVEAAGTLFAGLFGLLLGLGLLKFGNPILLDHLVDTPKSLDEWRVFAWPVRFGFLGLALATAAGLRFVGSRWNPPGPRWILGLLALWLLWQAAATLTSQDRTLSVPVLAHFTACATCFVLGHFALSRVSQPRTFWLCLTAGLIGVIGMAFDQHFGGLEATRRMILESPQAPTLSPEYRARIESNRVFSTLVYPNALAGVLLLLLPTGAWVAAQGGQRWGRRGAWCVGSAFAAAGLAVLVWSGSKSAWLLAMLATVLLLALGPLPLRAKLGLGTAFVALGLLAFGLVFREKLSRGATSVSARFDYWSAAVDGFRERPLLGHGPGLFKRVYAQRKRPESEMAQLTHNDYLQQAVDSGLPGFVAYSGLVLGGLLHRGRARIREVGTRTFAVWLGLSAWFTHGLVEFGLYIPASAWCAFALLGWLVAQKPSENPP